MSEPNHDARPEQKSDAYVNWPVEHATPADHDATDEIAAEHAAEGTAEDYEWIGAAGGVTQREMPYLYDPTESTIYRGEIDEKNERVVLRKHDENEEVSLVERIEAIGDEHGWSWLSSFARELLEADEEPPKHEAVDHEPDDTEFDRRSVVESAPYDLRFFGSHTFADEYDRVHIIDRRFDVYLDVHGSSGGTVDVEVDEDYLVVEESREDVSRGDAELVGDRWCVLGIDLDPDDPGWEQALEDSLREWHTTNADWPKRPA